MIIDTSVLITLLREEPESATFVPILAREYGRLKMSTASYLEAAIVIDGNDDDVLSERLDAVIAHFGIELVSVSPHHARVGREAYRTYGKGRHPAKLNFGDCFAYALSRTANEPLLFKGEDFARTDVLSAVPR